jgi:hypothetical protein
MAGRLRRPGQRTGELSWPGAGHGPERDEEAGGRAPWRQSPDTQLPGMQSLGIQLQRTQLADSGPAGTAFSRARLTDPVLIGGIAEITGPAKHRAADQAAGRYGDRERRRCRLPSIASNPAWQHLFGSVHMSR